MAAARRASGIIPEFRSLQKFFQLDNQFLNMAASSVSLDPITMLQLLKRELRLDTSNLD